MKALSIIDSLRPLSVGFDDVFRHFEHYYNEDLDAFETNKSSYNIVQTGDNSYDIEFSMPGHEKRDVEVSIEDNLLKVKSLHTGEANDKDKKYIHKGVEKNGISASFFIGKDVKVQNAVMQSGLLTITCIVDKPDGKDVKKIPVTNCQ